MEPEIGSSCLLLSALPYPFAEGTRRPGLEPSPSTHSSVSVHFSYFTESLHLICGEHFSQRYEDQRGSTGQGVKATGRQTGGRQIKRALLVSAHCATPISLHVLIGWLL